MMAQTNIFDFMEDGDKKMNKENTKKTKTNADTLKKYKWPFNFAIGADRLSPIPMPNAKTGDEFTEDEIKNVLKNMVLELNAPGTKLHFIEDRNTFVMSGQLAQKG